MLTVQNLSFAYPKTATVLNSIDLELNKGRIYGLFGKNGEGKSTLLKLMCGTLYPVRGRCALERENIQGRKASTLQKLFFVPESFDLPALELQQFEKVQSPFYPNFNHDNFHAILKEFKVPQYGLLSKLSYGQKKKVLLAFGLASSTSLLLMDEPTNGLDIPSKTIFRKILASYLSEDTCALIATHQVRDLHSLIDHILVLEQGQLIFDASLLEVTETLWFGPTAQAEGASPLYIESGFKGKGIYPRMTLPESEVDLELLFNGLLTHPSQITALFPSKAAAYGV
ncbi:MAG: ATP-binding cassette domain-containing protein [Bacteroidota bacterium]